MLKKIVDVMAQSGGKLCEFLHPSLQNGSDDILKRMNRRCLTDEYAEYVQYAREAVPHIHIGTDIITGFPGETGDTFAETVEFLHKIRFANIHVFPFSPRKGTAAWQMKPAVPNHLAGERAEILNGLKEIFAAEFRRSLKGTVQSLIPEKDGIGWTGNYVRVKADGSGLFRVRITGTDQEILSGEKIC
jgi:threonylcarbamoyladenosine tRNA methylthiotransferase MtaB